MAKYTINNKEVTKEEFDKQVYKGVEGTISEVPFFLDEVLDSFFPPKNKKEELKQLDLKKSDALKELEAYRYKIDKLEGAYDFKLPVTGVIHHTGGTIFEKIQDSTMGKHIDPFYMVDIKNIKSVEIPPIGFNIQDSLDAYKAIVGHSTRHHKFPEKSLEEKVGKKENRNKPQLSILFKQFPKALEALTKCSEYGNNKYKDTDSDFLNFKRVEGGSKTYADAGLRHRLETGLDESGLPHQFHIAWNAVAELQLWIEENE